MKGARRDAVGVITAFRGLSPFGEADRETFFGREAERGDLQKMIGTDRFRVGLVTGPAGVGKTSLALAGLLPALKEHGVVTAYAPGLPHALEALGREARARGTRPPSPGNEAEAAHQAVEALAAVGAGAKGGALFVIDDGAGALAEAAELDALAELLIKLGKAADGRTRFLFLCDDDLLSRFEPLEKRTGTLFSPNWRYRVGELDEVRAAQIIERTVLATGTFVEAGLSDAIAGSLAARGAIMPAELQVVAKTALELRLTSPAAFRRVGGASAMMDRFLAIACEQAGGDVGARVLGELVSLPTGAAADPDEVAGRAGLTAAASASALEALVVRGVARKVGRGGDVGSRYTIAHRFLLDPAREFVAPVRGRARRARVSMAEAAAQGRRLSVPELAAVRSARVVAATDDERRALGRGRRFLWMVAAGIVALPVIVLLVIYLSLAKAVYLAPTIGPDGRPHVLARIGKPSLSWFHWLPHSPHFGAVVADLGLSPSALDPAAVKALGGKAGRSSLNATSHGVRAWVWAGVEALRPLPRGVAEYALAGGKDDAFATLAGVAAGSDDDKLAVLDALEGVGGGGAAEGRFLAGVLANPSPRLHRRGLEVAQAIAKRRPGAYAELLAHAASAGDADARRSSLASAADMEPAAAAKLIGAALAAKDPATRRRALEAAGLLAERAPGVAAAAVMPALGEEDERLRAEARALVVRSAALAPTEVARALAQVAGDRTIGENTRAQALGLLTVLGLPLDRSLAEPLGTAANDPSLKVRAWALPLWAELAPPEDAAKAAEIAIASSPKSSAGLREAGIAALGEVAKSKPELAVSTLTALLDDKQATARTAAAKALGGAGGDAIPALQKLIKGGGAMAQAAAAGLGTAGQREPRKAIEALRPLLKVGAQSKAAIAALGQIGAVRPAVSQEEIARAIRDPKDPTAHAPGTDAACVVAKAQPKVGAALLKLATRDESLDVRRRASACVIALAAIAPEVASRLAASLVEDVDAGVRRDAATALAQVAERQPDAVDSLVALADDGDPGVRMAALAALKKVAQKHPPKGAGAALVRALGKADAGERRLIVDTAAALGAGEVLRAAASDADPGVRLAVALAVRGDDALVVLKGAVEDPETNIRMRAVAAVPAAGVAPDKAAALIEPALIDADPAVAAAALEAYAALDTPGVTRTLKAALASDREWRRTAAARAARALALHAPDEARKLFEAAAEDPSRDVRRVAIPALAALVATTTSLEQLGKALSSSERDARARALALAAMLTMAQKSPDDARKVAAALQPIADKGLPAAQLYARVGLGGLALAADPDELVMILFDPGSR